MLDEVEELNLLLEHYVVSWGLKISQAAECGRNLLEWGLRSQDAGPHTD
jgi:[phosphatase 2A protein]-leucine-carboxy methyltransferase